MALDCAALLTRIDQLLAKEVTDATYATIVEVMQGTVTLATIIYGATEPPQVRAMTEAAQHASKVSGSVSIIFWENVWPVVQGTLRAMRADVEAGLVGDIQRRATGEVLADMLGLAKEAFADAQEGTRNVAAVLTAAAFEDTIRKMGATLASVQGRPDLANVLVALKNAKVLVGAPATTAQSYLKFRNDALHADWAQLNDALVGSCLAFVEHLVLQHLS
jgi:hypothetical protein